MQICGWKFNLYKLSLSASKLLMDGKYSHNYFQRMIYYLECIRVVRLFFN